VIKFLLFAGVVVLVIALLRHGVRRKEFPAPDLAPQGMKSCAFCGVNFPASEALIADGRVFCSEDHRKLGAKE